MVAELLEIMRKGKVDFFLHKGHYNNPHKSGTAEFDTYERGWFQDLKASKKTSANRHWPASTLFRKVQEYARQIPAL